MTSQRISVTSNPQIHKIHSHNDENRKRPLIEALELGIPSVEADVWYFKDDHDETIFAGHEYIFLTIQKTLKNIYLDPIYRKLQELNTGVPKLYVRNNNHEDDQNGINNSSITAVHSNFESSSAAAQYEINPSLTNRSSLPSSPNTPIGLFGSDPTQTLYIWVDIKTEAESTYQAIDKILEPFRVKNWLTTYTKSTGVFHHGPVTIIASGNASLNHIEKSDVRDIFYDAPLGDLSSVSDILQQEKNSRSNETKSTNGDSVQGGFTPEISPFASGSLTKLVGSVGMPWSSCGLTKNQVVKLKRFVDDAKSRRLLTRVWGIPKSLFFRKKHIIWKQLIDEVGVDYLNADDLELATRYA